MQRSLIETEPLPAWGWGWRSSDVGSRTQVMRNTLSLNRGDGTYAEIAFLAGLPASEWTWGVAFLDADPDGFEDSLFASGHAHDIADSDAQREMSATRSATDRVTARKSFLEVPPLASANLASRNRGDLTFEEVGAQWGFDLVGIPNGRALADLDSDGDLDVALNNLNAPAALPRNDSQAPRVALRLRGGPANTRGIGARIKVIGGPGPQSQEMICGGR